MPMVEIIASLSISFIVSYYFNVSMYVFIVVFLIC